MTDDGPTTDPTRGPAANPKEWDFVALDNLRMAIWEADDLDAVVAELAKEHDHDPEMVYLMAVLRRIAPSVVISERRVQEIVAAIIAESPAPPRS